MPTDANHPNLKQQRLAEVLTDVENPAPTMRDALLRAGYSRSTALKCAGKTIEHPAVRNEVEKRKKSRSFIRRLTDNAENLLEKAYEQAIESGDAQLLNNTAATFVTAAQKLRDHGLVKDDDTPAEKLGEYHKFIVKLVQKVSRWAVEGKSGHIERFLRMHLRVRR